MKPLIRGSSVGLFDNGVFLVDTANSCPRYTVARMMDMEERTEEFNPVFRLGHIFEEWFCAQFPDGEREMLVTHEFDDIAFQGHVDLVTPDCVYELKSVSSVNVERDLRLRGKFKFGNLVQLSTYMLFLNRAKGKLIYGDYTKTTTYDVLKTWTEREVNETLVGVSPKLYEFNVSIRNDTEIFVGEKKMFDTSMIYAYIKNIAKLWDVVLPPHPAQMDDSSDVCFFCKLKDVCWNDSAIITQRDEFYNTIGDNIHGFKRRSN